MHLRRDPVLSDNTGKSLAPASVENAILQSILAPQPDGNLTRDNASPPGGPSPGRNCQSVPRSIGPRAARSVKTDRSPIRPYSVAGYAFRARQPTPGLPRLRRVDDDQSQQPPAGDPAGKPRRCRRPIPCVLLHRTVACRDKRTTPRQSLATRT